MKYQNIITYAIVLMMATLTLNARENPFIPTKSYVEKKAEMIDENYQYEMIDGTDTDEEIEINPVVKMDKEAKVKTVDPMEKTLSNGKHNFLSFVILEVNDNSLTITSHNQLIKKFDLNYKDTRKIVFDFKSSKGFFSKKALLNSMNFKEIAIGAHPEKGYYRIAITVDDIPSNYDVVYGENTIQIMKAQM